MSITFRSSFLRVILCAVAIVGTSVRAEDAHDHADEAHDHGDETRDHADDEHGEAMPGDHEHEHHDERRTARVAVLEKFGVIVAAAGPGVVDPGLELPGEIRPDATRTAHVAARFAGVARSVRARVGESVKKGDVLAVIESQTLAPYELRAPFDGIVVESMLVNGETADPERPAFVIADLSVVWAEISVYQKHLGQVRPGQRVRITAGYGVADAEGAVSYLSPILDETTRTATARAVLDNGDQRWRPGMFVTAYVLDPVDAAVAVPTTALQRQDDQTVVFVVDGDVFRPRPITIGRAGRTNVEVLAGLAPGERYAASGSYLIKAELGKSAEGHAH